MAPQHDHRDAVARVLGNRLVWFYVHAPLEICIQRDPKGLYARAKTGQVKQLLNYPFDVPRPQEQENYIDTVAKNIDGCCQSILEIVAGQLNDFAN
jgi:adenylylsulfate kinase-like enzyme